MSTTKVRKQANGATRYTAIVRLRHERKSCTGKAGFFAHRSAALSWARDREVALENPAGLTRLRQRTPTLAELIRW